MIIYRFRSQTEGGIMAFTIDVTGTNLPSAYEPWKPVGSSGLLSGHAGDPVAREIEEHGFFLISTPRIRRGGSYE